MLLKSISAFFKVLKKKNPGLLIQMLNAGSARTATKLQW